MTQPLFLVGARGCGKTTTGKALSAALGLHFIDTDHWLQREARMTVAQIVEQEGWEGFRARESQALQAVAADSTLVATGGGMVLAQQNRCFMRERGTVIYLCAPAQVLAQRLEASPEAGLRPTLTGRGTVDEVAQILAERDAIYRETAHHIVDASLPPALIVEHVTRALAQGSAQPLCAS
ncbi:MULTISPECIES: shikimate kinase AroL [Tenebrionibacter/Tenebrionicola group]|uniref:Shikimate kinase 2 n=2 Tax=Tenebrionibacter/Tenebrionicola group TaxID=2969848 RepID=A0A8K0V2H1_9ENTR|nr:MULTISPECIES: shikimate kinase AroL [Tenebrionibacter/Tenebrionicola group]MBK4715808.1 shikimate kinase AroL [Tenebrionibacter intestinalis]MBV4412779.1 shikimate kinase AroL [Tenebrionicola larvae]MBV5096506.1 shikimate kinase AroL [Tenebrionicola larvae]